MSESTTANGSSQHKVRRREDPVLITGKGQYVGDIRRPGMLHVSFLHSLYPHARIVSIDTSKAQAHSGVVRVVTGADIAHLGSLLINLGPGSWPSQPCLAIGEVNFVGEPVAAVVAESETAALDAVELIDVDYEVLPSVAGIEAALREDAPEIFNEQGNIVIVQEKTTGDVEGAFAQADKIVSLRLNQPRLALMPMEPRAILAEGHADGTLSVWISNQSIWLARLQFMLILQMSPTDIKITIPNVGGAFGGKTRLCGEEVVTAFLARELQRPVRWLENRLENIVSMGHGRGLLANMQAAVRQDGTVLALKAELFADLGGYPGDFSLASVGSTASMISGTYAIPAIQTIINGVKTNAAPTGPYRGAGRPEACYCIERTMDAIAHELALDPVEVRKRNLIPPDAFPYTTATGTIYDSGTYAQALDTLVASAGYQELRAEQARLRQQGQYAGVGLCLYIESTGSGGQSLSGQPDSGQVRIAPDGKILVESASVDSGQGHATTFAAIVAQEFGVPHELVEVQIGDSPNTHSLATFGSRSMAVGGVALKLSAQAVKAQMLKLAAHLLEVAEGDLEVRDGRVQVSGVPGKSYTLAQLATIAENPAQKSEFPEDLQKELLKGLCSMQGFEPGDLAYPFGAHLAVVQIDPATGEVKLRRYVAVDDYGCVLMPTLVEGQTHGAIAQGIGQALCEQMVYDGNGEVLSATLMDYAVPLADSLPRFELVLTETPSPLNILGVKGAGEAGTVAAPAAVANAVLDALSPLGITALDIPLTPENVWQAIHSKHL
ncbi:MAG TPA: xanthine dehydrogenase family protein molybdopterin-binding subunit [Ktedonosporobacter sp.]|jgi:carbon-monoxide dehydrogenase large subunit|nr:xanthine dehydrogenase family protein molybdopterin-binding subunit [Ktedonosporobacter sp.]